MAFRYLLHLGYDGNAFSGWQRQKNTKDTVQELLEEVISNVLHEKTTVLGCGRTDAGVHAAQYIAHIDVAREIPDELMNICNHLLSDYVALFEIKKIDNSWHARYSATERQYDYFLHLRKDPFLSGISSYYQFNQLDFIKMFSAFELLKGEHDFRYLCRQPEKHNHTKCNIKRISLEVTECGSRFHFQFVADRYLRGMIRIILAKLIDVGRGVIEVKTFHNYILGKEERKHKNMAYPQGLYLSGVRYHDLEFPVKSQGYLQLLRSFKGSNE